MLSDRRLGPRRFVDFGGDKGGRSRRKQDVFGDLGGFVALEVGFDDFTQGHLGRQLVSQHQGRPDLFSQGRGEQVAFGLCHCRLDPGRLFGGFRHRCKIGSASVVGLRRPGDDIAAVFAVPVLSDRDVFHSS